MWLILDKEEIPIDLSFCPLDTTQFIKTEATIDGDGKILSLCLDANNGKMLIFIL